MPEDEPEVAPKPAKKAAGGKPKKLRLRRPKAAKVEKAETPAVEEQPSPPALEPGHVHVYSLEGEPIRAIELPPAFGAEIRDDLIHRAVVAAQANRRQPYGASPRAGMRHSVRWSGKGHGVSRVPRLRGTMIGAQAPGTVGGRQAHPPRVQRIWTKKVNERERRQARLSALAALKDEERVKGRGHRFRDGLSLPIVVEDAIEALDPEGGASKAGAELLNQLGLWSDVVRAKDGIHIRAGHGKMRGRRYRTPKSLLFVMKDRAKVRRIFRNFPGVDVVAPGSLSTEVLAPGGHCGRLAIFSEGAIEALRGWSP